MFGFPVSIGDVSVGTIGLYRRKPGALSADQLGTTLTAVDDIAASLLEQDTWTEVASRVPAVEDPPVRLGTGTPRVHQAAGMTMIQLDVSINEALALLRATAFAEGKALADLAIEVVERRRRLGEADSDG